MSDRFHSTTIATAAQQGMVRIHRGAEVRYVWPVHLAGWLSSGWRTGEEPRPPQGASAVQVIPQRPGPEPTTAEPPTAVLAGAEREPLDAHLPTNLLDLDFEPAPPEAAPQNASERNDAGSASFAGSDLIGAGGPAAEPAPLEPAAAAAEPTAAAAPDPSPEAPQVPDPQQAQAPARRGRPRKARPESQPEPEAQPEAETPEQEQTPASLLFPSGDDPFGIDPL